MSLLRFKSHAIVNSGGVVSAMAGSVFQKNKRRPSFWREKLQKNIGWNKNSRITEMFDALFYKSANLKKIQSLSLTRFPLSLLAHWRDLGRIAFF